MLQHEFEELIGRNAYEGEYENVNSVYMTLDYLDKETICSIWKKADKSTKNLIINLNDMLHELREESIKANSNDKKLEEMESSLREVKEEYAGMLIAKSENGCFNAIIEASKRAKELTSMKWVVRYKIANGYKLNRDEREWVDNNLMFAQDN